MNKYLFVVPNCTRGTAGCEKMKTCLTTAKGLAESGNVVKLILDGITVLPLESESEVNEFSIPNKSENGNLLGHYMEKGYAVIRF